MGGKKLQPVVQRAAERRRSRLEGIAGRGNWWCGFGVAGNVGGRPSTGGLRWSWSILLFRYGNFY